MKLTQEEVENRVEHQLGTNYKIISKYTSIHSLLKVHCEKHNYDFEVAPHTLLKDHKNKLLKGCPQCKREIYKTVSVSCAYCGKSFDIKYSYYQESFDKLHFCCREHKDLAQRICSGDKFNGMRPSHYGDIPTDYRKEALNHYANKCYVCGWDEDPRVLEVHHKDENRKNNSIDNLVILCPTCHKKVSLHLYKLIDNKLVEF